MTDDGIHVHVTSKGTCLIVARQHEESITFNMPLSRLKQLRDELNRAVSTLEPDN